MESFFHADHAEAADIGSDFPKKGIVQGEAIRSLFKISLKNQTKNVIFASSSYFVKQEYGVLVDLKTLRHL